MLKTIAFGVSMIMTESSIGTGTLQTRTFSLANTSERDQTAIAEALRFEKPGTE